MVRGGRAGRSSPGFERVLRVAGEFGFGEDGFALVRCQRRASGETASSYRNPHLIERAALLKQFSAAVPAPAIMCGWS